MKRNPRRVAPTLVASLLLVPFVALGDAKPGASESATAATDPASDLDAALRADGLEHAIEGALEGIAVLDVDSGRLLAALNEHLPLNPASNAKLYTAGAALATLRGEHRYETSFSGKVGADAVIGPLAIRGFGDPSLTTADLWAMVRELKGYGVRHVEGDVVVDQRFFDEQTTPPAFEQQPTEWSSFRAPVSAVAIDENCISFTVRPGAPGAPAHFEFEPPGLVDADGAIKTMAPGTPDNVSLALAGSGGRMSAHVGGTIASDSPLARYTRRTEDPRLLAGYAVKALLEKADIHVTGGVKLGTARGQLLARHVSEPLSSLLYALGKQSDNFYAEMIYRSLAGEMKGQPATSNDASQVVTHWLEGIGAAESGVAVRNGSGLYDADRATPLSLAQVLRWAWREPSVQPEFVAQLSVGGIDGTLRKRFRDESTRRRVRAKTGTLDDVVALSGYVLREGGRGPLAFSILFNRVAGKQDRARNAADRIVEHVARYAMRP